MRALSGVSIPVGPGTVTLTVTFTPGGMVSATRTAAIHIASNNRAEGQFAALGFDWRVSQPTLVDNYYSSANTAGLFDQTQYDANRTAGRNDVINSPNTCSLYPLAQVQALNRGVPLLSRDAGTGKFKLTIGVQKTTNLSQPFIAFPRSASQTASNAQGQLEFLFTVPDNAAFFRVQSQ